MTLAIVYTRAGVGIEAPLVTVETHLSPGLPGFNIVGLPEASVKESKDRVRSALMNLGLEFPPKRIIINLAPADLPKGGSRFDLPIAIGILAASEQIPLNKLSDFEFTGELALTGELRRTYGVLPMVLGAKKANRKMIVPLENQHEAALVSNAEVYSAKNLLEICTFLKDESHLKKCVRDYNEIKKHKEKMDLLDVIGQVHAKRALEIAAAGRHNLLLMGPPGTGKTMLASRLASLLPALSDEKALEVAAINSLSRNGFEDDQWKEIPFRSPHHSCSSFALVGGGRPPRPGEISLAHHGILFLDELTEFNRAALEALREPLESGKITISRASYQNVFPANFQFIAAMNPCPCGYYGSRTDSCRCTYEQVRKYLHKLSGPLLDRIDMHVAVPKLNPAELLVLGQQPNESSEIVKERIVVTQELQISRQGKLNSQLCSEEVKQFALNADCEKLMSQITQKYNLSGRVFHRILKVARTIADMEKNLDINEGHISEAFSYRVFDKMKFNDQLKHNASII